MSDKNPPRHSIFWRLTGSAAILMIHFLVFFLVFGMLVSIVSKYQMLFDEIDVELPAGTALLFSFSYFFTDFWYLMALFFMMVDVTFVVLLSMLSPKKIWLLSFYSHTVLFVAVILLVWINACLLLPIARLLGPLT